MSPNRLQVLRLYKDLLRYGELLTFTDKKYFKKRIRQEFNSNKNISSEEVTFFYELKTISWKLEKLEQNKVPYAELDEEDERDGDYKNRYQKKLVCLMDQSWGKKGRKLVRRENRLHVLWKSLSTKVFFIRNKRAIDKSKFPTLLKNDLVEQFIKGGGPGGQRVNKTNNCINLLHKPTGLRVKVQESRDQAQNRQIAREKLTKMLDNFINKEYSIENQKKQILVEKSIKRTQKQKKLMEMKNRWKQIISEYS